MVKQIDSVRDVVEDRIIELTNILTIKLSRIKGYALLPEIEKIPFRIMAAEIRALKEFSIGEDMDAMISGCVEQEHYAGAEGLKLAKEWISKQLTA